MRGYRIQNTDANRKHKLISRAGLGVLAGTILCGSLGIPAPSTQAATIVGPRATELLPSRVLLLLMLESLEDALADDPERPAAPTAEGDDGLEAGAQALIMGYSMYGIDPSLLPADALEAADTADSAEWVLVTQELGLNPSLAIDLFATLQDMKADLQDIGS